jgi:hypothetical protein
MVCVRQVAVPRSQRHIAEGEVALHRQWLAKRFWSRLGAASLWIDYVPSESNPADVPSRFHEMNEAARCAAAAQLGDLVRMVVPELSDGHGIWLSSKSIALSVWRS